MTHHTPMKLKTVRNLDTGEITTQSSTKTKQLLKLGNYEEVRHDPGGIILTHQRTPQRDWRAIGTWTAVAIGVVILLVWLRFVQVI